MIQITMKNLIQSLANQINNFDTFYMMSDDSRVYDKWTRIKSELNSKVSSLSLEEKHELKSQIEDEMNFSHFGLKDLEALPETKKESPKSSIFKAAWYFFKKGIYTSFSEALKAAWRRFKVIRKLASGQLEFTFRKGTGEIRKAIGTLNIQTKPRSTKEAKYTPDVIAYYDIESDGWRRFRIERLIAA